MAISADLLVAMDREREHRWEHAMDMARKRYAHHALATELTSQVDAWTLASRMRGYCNELESGLGKSQPSDEPGARAWLEWARNYAESIDPLGVLPTMPGVQPAKTEDLIPFLDGWSPYGP